MGLVVFHYISGIVGTHIFKNKAMMLWINLQYGGTFSMSYIILKYWDDAFTNSDHFFAHYIPAAVCLLFVIKSNTFTIWNTSPL